MTGESEPPRPDDNRIEAALRSLGNETRLAILQALLDAPEWTMTFTDLMEAVGIEDSGHFSYHLGELEGDFVRRTDEGYEPRYGGVELYRAILSGMPPDDWAGDPIPAGGTCRECGGGLQGAYENDRFYISCRDCGETFYGLPFPPGGLAGRSDEELLAAFDRHARAIISRGTDGLCPGCSGPMAVEFPYEGGDDLDVPGYHVVCSCDRCGTVLAATVGEALVEHPAVVGFFYEHGVDVRDVRLWNLPFCVSGDPVEVVSEDPVRVRVTVEHDDDALELVVDGSLSIVDAEPAGG